MNDMNDADSWWGERQLAAQAAQLDINPAEFTHAWTMTRRIVRDQGLTNEGKALRIVQQFVNAGWRPRT